MRAAAMVMATISRRSWSSCARTGAASRQTAMTAWTWPAAVPPVVAAGMIGRYSRMTAVVSSASSAPAAAGVVIAACACCWPIAREQVVRAGRLRPDAGAVVAHEDRAVGLQQRHVQELAALGQEGEARLEGRPSVGRQAAWGDVLGLQVEADEGPHGRGVGADGRAQQGLLLVGRDERGLAAGGHPHDQQEGPEDEPEQRRPRGTPRRPRAPVAGRGSQAHNVREAIGRERGRE